MVRVALICNDPGSVTSHGIVFAKFELCFFVRELAQTNWTGLFINPKLNEVDLCSAVCSFFQLFTHRENVKFVLLSHNSVVTCNSVHNTRNISHNILYTGRCKTRGGHFGFEAF